LIRKKADPPGTNKLKKKATSRKRGGKRKRRSNARKGPTAPEEEKKKTQTNKKEERRGGRETKGTKANRPVDQRKMRNLRKKRGRKNMLPFSRKKTTKIVKRS